MNIENSLITNYSVSKKETNEDFVDIFKNEKLNIRGVIVADGIGSQPMAHLGSKFCVTKLKELLENCKSYEKLNISKFFTNVAEALKETHKKEYDELQKKMGKKLTDAFGTTLICAIELENKFIVAYVGNGSVWHLRGNFPELLYERRLFPWCALNYLNPHSLENGGKPSLYKFISYNASEEQVKPSIIQIQKDNVLYGDILIITTDGISSNDQVFVGKDKTETIWIEGEDKLIKLLHHLKNFLQQDELNIDKLNQTINEYSEEIKNSIDDDSTFGVIISNQVINYRRKANGNNTGK